MHKIGHQNYVHKSHFVKSRQNWFSSTTRGISLFLFLYTCTKICTANLKKKGKKKRNTLIYFNTNYLTEMKLVPIIMDYCLLQFDALKFFFGVRLHGGSQPNFSFFSVNPQLFQRNRKVHLAYCLENKFSQHF